MANGSIDSSGPAVDADALSIIGRLDRDIGLRDGELSLETLADGLGCLDHCMVGFPKSRVSAVA